MSLLLCTLRIHYDGQAIVYVCIQERVRINQEIEVLCADRERLTQKQRTQGDVGEVTQLVREVQAVVPTASPPTPSEGATAQLPPPPEHHVRRQELFELV